MKMVTTRYTGLMCMEGHVYCEYIQKVIRISIGTFNLLS